MIRCGRCKSHHPTVAAVRACYESPKRQQKWSRSSLGAKVNTLPQHAGRTRDKTKWERDPRTQASLERLRDMNNAEYGRPGDGL